MSWQRSTEVTFHDVAACLSEEEWKPLHQWQKDLYRNVMKEIDQALISLGPLIASTVISVMAKENKEPVPEDNQDSQRRHGNQKSPSEGITNSEVVFRINREENLCLKNSWDTEGGEQNDCLITEAVSILIDGLGMEVGENSSDPISGCDIVSFHIKEEEEAYCIDNQDSRRIESTGSPTGDGGMNTPRKDGDYVKCTKKTPPCKASSGKVKATVQQRSNKGRNSKSQLWAGLNWELGGENSAHCQKGFSKPEAFIVHQGPLKLERCDKRSECKSKRRKSELPTCIPKAQQSQKPYTCTECKKSFSLMGNLRAHMIMHTGEKPYPCSDCHQSFSRKNNLNEHRLYKHTGVRPYQCTDCETSFTRRDRLDKHRRLHTGP